jgi:signal transduction histidine kinase
MKAQNEDWAVSGYLNMDGRLIEVAASAILDSNGQGPLHGTLLFTHELTDEDITGFAVSSGGTYRFVTTSDAMRVQQYSEGLWLKPTAIDTFIGVVELPLLDVSSKGYLEATLPRPIYLEGLRLNSVLLLTLVGVFILATFTAIYVNDVTLLKQINNIGSALTTLKPSEEMTHMLNIENNELNTIIKGVNTLIDEVETSKTKLKEQERLVAMGKVASMVGHDLRNPLQVLTSTSFMIRKKQEKWGTRLTDEENQTLNRYLSTIDDQTSYMDKIVSDIQYYSKDFKPQTKPADVMDIARNTVGTIRIPETIRVTVDQLTELPRVDADSQLIQRVFTNLIINAVQAMPVSGALAITGERVGDYVRVCVKDTGVGMTPELRGKLFTPFFTTKAKGSGLGLAAGKRIVDAHGGTMTVESTPGQGSCFYFTLPVSKNQ